MTPYRTHVRETERGGGGQMLGGGRRMPGWRQQTDPGVEAASAPRDCSCASATRRGNAPGLLTCGFLPRGKRREAGLCPRVSVLPKSATNLSRESGRVVSQPGEVAGNPLGSPAAKVALSELDSSRAMTHMPDS